MAHRADVLLVYTVSHPCISRIGWMYTGRQMGTKTAIKGPWWDWDGTKLLLLRTRKLLTQAEVAEKIGVTQATVARWERNAVRPPIPMRKMLCTVFGIGTEEILP